MKNKKVLNKKNSTEIGVGIVLLVAIVIGGAFYLQGKKEQPTEVPEVKQPQILNKQTSTLQQNNVQTNDKQGEDDSNIKPAMPTISDESGKSPEQIVKDFYEWYIENTNYLISQIYNKNQDKNIINLDTLVQQSPFVSLSYEKNISKRKGMYDSVLCTNDNEYNVVKEYGKAQIKNNISEVDVLRGYSRNDSTTKIQVMLIRENSQWKINDIICNF